VNLSHTKQQHFVRSSAQPHHFFTTLKSHEALVTSHSKTMALSLGRHFHSYLYACTLNDHLATKQTYYSKSLNTVVACTWQWIEEPVYALCCQLNKALEKTEVGPYQYECI